MAMTARLFGISALAVELNRDRRTIARALRHVRHDGEISGHRAWYVATAVAALNRTEGMRGNTGDCYDESDLVALEDGAAQVQRLIDDLADLPDLQARRRLMEAGGGKAIGELAAAFDRVESRRDANARMVSKPFVDMVVGRCISEVLDLCGWKLAS